DLSLIASDLDAKRNIGLAAQGDVTIASGADESHSYYKSKKVTAQEDHVKQVASTITAGGDVAVSAGNDLALISSRITAGDEAYLVAGNNIELLAAQDTDYSLYEKKKKGSFGQKESRRDEVTQVTHVGSEISTGGDLTLVSGGDQRYQVAKLDSGGDLTLESGGSITFEAVKDLHQESHEKSSNSLAWTSMSGKGSTDETLRQSELVAQGQLAFKAVDGLNIDIKQINQKSVSETIDAMVQADPQLAWLKDAEKRGDVDWRRVQEVHESFKYSHSGLGQGAVLAIMIVVAALTAGAASAALGSVAGAGAGSGTAMAAAGTSAAGVATGAGWANVALTAVATSAAGSATVSTINNKGNLGAVLKDVTSSDALKGYVITGITAGMTAAYFNDWTGTTTDPVTGKITTNLSTWKGIGQFAANQGLQNGTSAALGRIMGQSGDLGNALQSTLFNTLAAASFNAVGDYTKGVYADGSVQKIMIHAVVGGLLTQISGGDFKTGALAAGANEALVQQLDIWVGGDENLLTMSSQLVGMLAAATQSGVDGESLQLGSWVAQNATQYNYLEHKDIDALAKDMAGCGKDESCQKDKWEKEYNQESLELTRAAMDVSGALGAKDMLPRVIDSLEPLLAMVCETTTCQTYKTVLIERTVAAAEHLAGQITDWGPSMDRFGLLGTGVAAVEGPLGSKPRPPGASTPAGLAQVGKAVEYLRGVKELGATSAGPKVPPKLQPLSNPPQGPVIPADWVSRPGKTPGSTIYYPLGSDPSAPGSTYIRLMPSGSTPVPGLENGYWISVKNGQPTNPATGGTGPRGDTHVPLPPNTVPPER
ncbi:DUF637 domain-containing protein, partial [Pseudomonas sp. SDO55104_S430]